MRRLPTVLSDEELAALYATINEATATGKRDRALLQVMADAGLRISEALALRTRDLRVEGGRITAISVVQGKGGKDRTVYPTPQLSDKLLLWLAARAGLEGANGTVFCRAKGDHGAAVGARTVQELVKALAAEAGIEKRVSPHSLRHTAATRALRAGNSLRMVQENLGHARLEATQVYTHVEDSEREAAAQLLPAVDGKPAEATDPLEVIMAALAGLPVEKQREIAARLTS